MDIQKLEKIAGIIFISIAIIYGLFQFLLTSSYSGKFIINGITTHQYGLLIFNIFMTLFSLACIFYMVILIIRAFFYKEIYIANIGKISIKKENNPHVLNFIGFYFMILLYILSISFFIYFIYLINT